ncbi:small ribosomal subunit Rsm22 family protein [Pseudobacteriovorax antillogorgiicola]|uniref:Small ribosomal subunit Rsm22 n=1 Tax=Pseudobacteriovorax antillogorgiicola TaxID=1513793 RepID=A0A1Y6C5E1_9BACT|nr:small ribosomal subunit Rsm22 family protein [Pseudobacteriovorax antillogorgiicola]TCS49434.1 small ribosomal subunit Rsm22 [Pseudobacteriovorax antillogorgiicola]SMF46662.1 small ribosomal subunit Rsm22 [Pseudobacteriovorax antillogorgiicola]
MKKTNTNRQFQEVALPSSLISAWEATIIETARLKGIPRDSSKQEKLKTILRNERGNVRSLWEAFTTDRQNLPRYLLDPKKQTSAYLLGFHLANCGRAWNLLDRMDQRHKFSETLASYEGAKVFDLGCGTGAVSQTLAAFVMKRSPKTKMSLSLVDTQGPFLDASRLGFKHVGFKGSIRSKKDRLENCFDMISSQLSDSELNIVILGYVWNELLKNPKAQRKFQEFAMESMLKPTLFLIIEPANQNLARSAMELRDDLSMMGYHPLYPCPSSVPCPMLQKPKDWCYSETTWAQPQIMADLDRYLEINRSKLKYAGYALASEKAGLVKAGKPGESVVVGRPKIQDRYKDDFEYLICKGDDLGKRPSKVTGKKVLNRGEVFQDRKKD